VSERKQYQRKKLPQPKYIERGNRVMCDIMWQCQRPRPTFASRQEAELWYAEQVVRMSKGEALKLPESHQSRSPATSGGKTLHELFEHVRDEHWLKTGPNGGPKKSWDKIEIAVTQAVKAIGPNVRLPTLTVQGVEKALKKLEEERNNTPRTTNRRMAALLVMLKEAVRQGWMPTLLPLKKAPEIKTGRIFRITAGLERDMLLYALALQLRS
jgi:hypothetical protein